MDILFHESWKTHGDIHMILFMKAYELMDE